MNMVIKGTSILWNPEDLRKSENALGEMLLSVFHTLKLERDIENQIRRKEGLPELDITRIEGLISSYLNGLTNEIHSLAIKIDMMYYLIDKATQGEIVQKDTLYLTSLLESYFTSLRVIFDYVSVIYRIVIEEKKLNQVPSSDSFNDTLKFMKKDIAKSSIPQEIIDIFLDYEETFDNIKKIRDLIIHKGKEPIIYKDTEGYSFSINTGNHYSKINEAADILQTGKDRYPLIEYLSKLTNQVIEFTSELGVAIYECLSIKRDEKFNINFSALEGVCIPGFIKFLSLTNNEILPVSDCGNTDVKETK